MDGRPHLFHIGLVGGALQTVISGTALGVVSCLYMITIQTVYVIILSDRTMSNILIILLLRPSRGAGYCDQSVCVCV